MGSPASAGSESRTYDGIAASPGIVSGPAYVRKSDELEIVEQYLHEDEIHQEIDRFNEALDAARVQMATLREQAGDSGAGRDLLDAHLLVLEDDQLLHHEHEGLRRRRRNAEFIVHSVMERFARELEGQQSARMRERAADIRDVARRILRMLTGQSEGALQDIPPGAILVAHDLAPSEAALLHTSGVAGLALDLGSHTSHTAIMARAHELPGVVGLHDVSYGIASGDPLLLDGLKGRLIVHPGEEQLREYETLRRSRSVLREQFQQGNDLPAETLDGRRITLSANIESLEEMEGVRSHGAEGVGLFRTEFLYMGKAQLPSEEEQTDIYLAVARAAGEQPVIIRTLDLGGDKSAGLFDLAPEMNPFLGCRAIRLCLLRPEIFRIQLRALLRASIYRNIRIMYPMVSSAEEVVEANTHLDVVKAQLREERIPFNEEIQVGAMIEIPSAAIGADLIAPRVDFFSMGTNDLIQYTFAVDRVNDQVASLYRPAHPVIFKLIDRSVRAGRACGIWTGVCGEMASDPLILPVLLGLGADELSVTPSAVPMIKAVIRKLDQAECEALAQQALSSSSEDEVLKLCRKLLRKRVPEVLELYR